MQITFKQGQTRKLHLNALEGILNIFVENKNKFKYLRVSIFSSQFQRMTLIPPYRSIRFNKLPNCLYENGVYMLITIMIIWGLRSQVLLTIFIVHSNKMSHNVTGLVMFNDIFENPVFNSLESIISSGVVLHVHRNSKWQLLLDSRCRYDLFMTWFWHVSLFSETWISSHKTSGLVLWGELWASSSITCHALLHSRRKRI